MNKYLIRRPFLLFFINLYFFLIHFNQWDPFNLKIDFLIYKISVLLVLAAVLFNYNLLSIKKDYVKFLVPLILLFVYQTLISYINQSINNNDYLDINFLINLFILIISINLATENKNYINSFLLSFTIGGVILGIFYLLDIETSFKDGRVLFFGVGNQNMIGFNISICILYLVYAFVNKIYKYKLIIIISIFILLLLLVSTGSRSGFIGFTLGLLILVYLNRKNYYSYIILFIVAIVIGLFLISSEFVIWGRLVDSYLEQDLSGRDLYWEKAFEIIKNNLFFGVGTTGYKYQIENIMGFYASAHNLYIETLAKNGAIGLFLLITFFYQLIKHALITRISLSLILLIPLFIVSLFGHPLGMNISWLIFALIISMRNEK